jgi:hypothetical protein
VIPDLRQEFAQTLRQWHPAARNADQHYEAVGVVSFCDLMGDASEGTLDGWGVQDGNDFRHGEKKWGCPGLRAIKKPALPNGNPEVGRAGEARESCSWFLGDLAGAP